MNRTFARVAIAAAVLLAAGGCRNPFDPSADIELTRLEVTGNGSYGGTSIVIYQTELAGPTYAFGDWVVTCRFTYKNKVSAYLNSVTITYTDIDGNPVTAYKAVGGRTFKITFRIPGVRDDNFYYEGEGIDSSLSLRVVDLKVIEELKAPPPGSKVIFADIVLRGQDDNGYDLRLEGRIAIFVYQ
ncbi:MAG: hypothetical protein AAB152_15150 [Candidatus Coatesbacteria bacterium]